MKKLTTLEIQRATGDWAEGEIDSYAALIPAWLRTAIQQANAPRKSVKIGLCLTSTILTARRQLSWPVEAGDEFNPLFA